MELFIDPTIDIWYGLVPVSSEWFEDDEGIETDEPEYEDWEWRHKGLKIKVPVKK